MRVTSESGDTATWQLESWGSPYVLSRMGVTQDQFVVGSQVRLAGRVSTITPNRFLLTNMLRADGTEVVLTTDGDAFWPSRQVGGRAQWQDKQISTAADEGRGLFRVWSTARMGQARNNRVVLTASALAARESFDQPRSFVVTCEPQGMPTVMNWVYPFEFTQTSASTITLRNEYFDLERTIHMEPAVVPAGIEANRLGYSIGRWEDDGRALVVETTALNWPYYDTIGTPLSSRRADHRALHARRRPVDARLSADRDRSRDVHRAGGARVAAHRARRGDRAVRLRSGAVTGAGVPPGLAPDEVAVEA